MEKTTEQSGVRKGSPMEGEGLWSTIHCFKVDLSISVLTQLATTEMAVIHLLVTPKQHINKT